MDVAWDVCVIVEVNKRYTDGKLIRWANRFLFSHTFLESGVHCDAYIQKTLSPSPSVGFPIADRAPRAPAADRSHVVASRTRPDRFTPLPEEIRAEGDRGESGFCEISQADEARDSSQLRGLVVVVLLQRYLRQGTVERRMLGLISSLAPSVQWYFGLLCL